MYQVCCKKGPDISTLSQFFAYNVIKLGIVEGEGGAIWWGLYMEYLWISYYETFSETCWYEGEIVNETCSLEHLLPCI